MPMEAERYPKNWKAFSRAIKDQVNWICQQCGQQCRKEREPISNFANRVAIPSSEAWQEVMNYPQRFCLNVGHLDQNPRNNQRENLLVFCQPCHLNYDRPFIPQNTYARRERQGQQPISPELGVNPMLVVSSTGNKQSVCLHSNAVLQGSSAHCPDCEKSFQKRSKAYKEIFSREQSQTCTPTRLAAQSDSTQSPNLPRAARSNGKASHNRKNATGANRRRTDQTGGREIPEVTTHRAKVNGDSWNTSSEGLNFWERVELVWPYLSKEERHHVYFTKAVDYPRPFEMLEAIESRRQLPLELPADHENFVATQQAKVNGESWNNSPEGVDFWERVDLIWPYLGTQERDGAYFTKAFDYARSLSALEAAESRRQITLPLEPIKINGKAIPQDANSQELKIGDRVTAAWEAGRNVYFGVIESFSGRKRFKAHGRWTEGRRAGDSDSFSVETNSLIRVAIAMELQPSECRVGGLYEEYRGFSVRAFYHTNQWKAYVYRCSEKSEYDDTLVSTTDNYDECSQAAKQWIDEFWTSQEEQSEFKLGDRVKVLQSVSKYIGGKLGVVVERPPSGIREVYVKLNDTNGIPIGFEPYEIEPHNPSETPLVDEYTQRDWPEYFKFHDQLRELEDERDHLAKDAEFAPENGWVETGRVKGKEFRQAWWRGNFPNGKKTIYIGREGSPEYGKAKTAQQARKQLKKVLRQIEQLRKEAAHAVS
jgi:hypothetical protein